MKERVKGGETQRLATYAWSKKYEHPPTKLLRGHYHRKTSQKRRAFNRRLIREQQEAA